MSSTTSNAVDLPLVSVVSICFNCPGALARTIDSVAEQSYQQIEHIVVDGGSGEETERVAKHPRVDVFLSELDRGISHAFNRGLAVARGEYLVFINAGDGFRGPRALESLVQLLPMDGSAAMVSGPALCSGSLLNPRGAPRPGASLRERARLAHQGTLIPRTFFDRYGPYSESFGIRMDFEWFLRALRDTEVIWHPEPVVYFELGGRSNSAEHAFQHELEGVAAELVNARSDLERLRILALRGPLALARALAKKIVRS